MNIFESHTPLPGARATESAHRKIELQAPEDLTYLIANVTRAAREKIDRDLPPKAAAGEEDVMRKRVEQLVDEYIQNTFGAAKESITINGMEAGEMERELARGREGEEIEPFDTQLAQRVQALSAQIENYTLQLANLRRTAPAESSRKFQEGFTRASEQDDARSRMASEGLLEQAKETKVDVGEMQRLDEVQATLQSGSENLVQLKSELGGTIAKMERAGEAVRFVER